MAFKIPTRTVRAFIEHRGEYRDIQVEDRPFRLLKDQFDEDKGTISDVEVPLTDYEILEAGGLETFFDAKGNRKKGAWPYDPNKKKPAKKKAKKKTTK